MGFLAVALGAFGAHGLKHFAPPNMVNIFNLAVDYQFYHTFAIIVVAFAGHWIKSSMLNWAAICFAAGIILFSGSLYLYVLLGFKWLVHITPMGGGLFMLGWLLMAIAVWRDKITTTQ